MTHLLGGLEVQNARGLIINDLRDVSHTSGVRSAIHYLAIYRISIPLDWALGTDINSLIGGTELRTNIVACGAIQAPEEFLCQRL